MPKRRNAPVARGSSSDGGQKTEVAQLARERDEALEQLSAASEVLRVISSSPGDLKPVFDTILENATRICGAGFGNLYLHEENGLRLVAQQNTPVAFATSRCRELYRPHANAPTGRLVRTKRVIHVTDLALERLARAAKSKTSSQHVL